MQDAMEDMVASQGQNASSTSDPHGSQAANPLQSMLQGKQGGAKTARPIGTPLAEGKFIAEDVAQGIIDLLPGPLKNLLGPAPTDTPEEKAKKQAMFQRYQQLSAEDQQYVQKKMQEEAVEKQKLEQEETQKKQMAAQQKPAFEMPQGKVRGDAKAGQSKKQNTISKLQDDRQKLKNAA
jgi:hypothetical protein